ncbi:polysaccharide deacetylase [Mesorhizobium sp. ZC-5]|uniref:polysaccharide deacetylase n=1 Tax=Mesorhizobium sp. ZC-5 TaxID=2986066 RepID=UPI0021E89D01|nr:polysaccharide deacetylase [Mesorhizobium sp. ZC-5]
MSVASRLCTAVSAFVAGASPLLAGEMPRHPQYVIISFDGAHDIAQWKRSRALAEKTGAKFTYFLSCVFLLSPETKRDYQAPGKGPGKSNVGFALTRDEVSARLAQIWAARGERHEIASHGCGHFDGADWNKADWLSELSQFTTILRDAYSANHIAAEPAGWQHFAETEIKGFRAPYLSTNKSLYAALAGDKFSYDASGVSRGPAEPSRDASLTRFSLPQIAEGPKSRRVIAMDYNLFVRHSGGLERPSEAKNFEDRAYDAFLASFDAEYNGKRTPFQVGFHFTLMNGGAYWRALERFAEEVCVRPEVACVSYRDYLARTRPAPAGPDERPGTTMGG